MPPNSEVVAVRTRLTGRTGAWTYRRLGGFSLLELLVCIAIIALLVSFLVYSFAAVWKFVHKVIDMAQG